METSKNTTGDRVRELSLMWCKENVPSPDWALSGQESEKVDIHQLNHRLRGFFVQCYREAYKQGQEDAKLNQE